MNQPPLDLVIEHLEGSHARHEFDCGKPKLNAYLHQFANQHQKRHIGRTFVLVAKSDPKVLGFYTLAAGSVGFQHLPDSEKLPKYPVPVVKLGQLAVDLSIKGRGWGEYLLFDALARAERISFEVAVFALELDAIDDDARSFYLKYGFLSLRDEVNHMYLPMKQIANFGLNSRPPKA